MDLLKKFRDIILPSPDFDDEQNDNNVIRPTQRKKSRNSLIVEEIMYCFMESLEDCSTDRSLLFHSSYVAYIPQSYFKSIHLQYGVLTQEIVDRFHEVLAERLRSNPKLRFTPLCKNWSFDLIPLAEGGRDNIDGDNPDTEVSYEDLEDSFVAVRSSLVPDELFAFDGEDDDTVIKTNRSQPSSKFENAQRLNIEAIRGLKPSGSGFIYPISTSMPETDNDSATSTTPAQHAQSHTQSNVQPSAGAHAPSPATSKATSRVATNPTAVIRSTDESIVFIDSPGANKSRLAALHTEFFIGGSSASTMYHGKPIYRLSDESIMSPHLEIRLNDNGRFELRAIGQVEVNGIPAARNEWIHLADRNTSIMLNEDIELIFNKN